MCINDFATADEVERSRTVGVKTETFSPEYIQTLRLSTEVTREDDSAMDGEGQLDGRSGRFGTPLGESSPE